MKISDPDCGIGSLSRREIYCSKSLQRINFFTGRLLTVEDLTAEQNYHREKQRRHNLQCHGYGIVNGLKVSIDKSASGSSIVVEPGVGIDPLGNEVHICTALKLALPKSPAALLVAIKFVERFVGSIPVPGIPDEPQTMPARVEEGCEVILELPTTADSKALALAHVVLRSTGWRLNRRFRASRAR